MHFGQPTEAQIAAYTRVLQGHIAIDAAVFPEGTPGCAIDAFARRALWAAGLDYAHGTVSTAEIASYRLTSAYSLACCCISLC
jgi:Xaa-Pro aminopeptidase